MIFILRILEATFVEYTSFNYDFEDFATDIIVIAVFKFFAHLFTGNW